VDPEFITFVSLIASKLMSLYREIGPLRPPLGFMHATEQLLLKGREVQRANIAGQQAACAIQSSI